jgi:hypothetical protein
LASVAFTVLAPSTVSGDSSAMAEEALKASPANKAKAKPSFFISISLPMLTDIAKL